MTESPILAAVLVAVSALPGCLFYRHNTGKLPDRDGKRWVSFGLEGSGDIMGCCRGRAVSIETKSLTGRQRQAQIRFQAAWTAAGGVYIIARHPDDALTVLRSLP